MRDISNLQLNNGAALIIISLTVAFDIVISAIVTEYGGELKINAKYGVFNLDVVFPR